MIKHIPVDKLHRAQPAHWLDTIYHFSFANYYNPNNMNFGALRVLNDDLISAHSGFSTHPHNDMEIISYVVDGALTHQDSLGNKGVIKRGEVQYMSAGSGIYHSEFNEGDETVRLFQIWFPPDSKNLTPNYGDYKYEWSGRQNKLLHLVSPWEGNANVKLHQDINMYATELEADKSLELPISKGRQCYVVQIEGISKINGKTLNQRDALEAYEEDLKINAIEKSHLLFIEMKLDQN